MNASLEIQELRHQTQSSKDPQSSSSGVIDQALMSLDERLESVNRGMKAVADLLNIRYFFGIPFLEVGGFRCDYCLSPSHPNF